MNPIACPLLALFLLAAEDKPAEPAPKLPLGKETTYFTGPRDKDGYIDYEAALNDLLSKDITPEKNANVLIWKALGPTPDGGKAPAEFFKRLGIEEPPVFGDYFVGPKEFTRDRIKLDKGGSDAFDDQISRAAKRPWTAKEYPHVADWLKANEKPLANVVEATKRQDYYNPIICKRNDKGRDLLISASLAGVQKCRELANALAARAMLRLGESKLDEAWQDLLACHRLGRLIARGAFLIEALVGIALDWTASHADLAYIERANLTAKQVLERLKDLQSLPPMPPMTDKIDLGERCMYLDVLQSVIRSLGNESGKKLDAEQLKALETIDWAPVLRDGNGWYDRFAALPRLRDRAERDKTFVKIEDDMKAQNKKDVKPAELAKLVAKLVHGQDQPEKMDVKAIGDLVAKATGDSVILLMMPAANQVQNAHDRAKQVQRNLHVAFALAAYHSDVGRYPAKLEELAPKYLATVPDDLFSGKALIYRPSDKGYLFYSLGINGKDEEGRSYDDDPPGKNLPVRMPLPELKPKKNLRKTGLMGWFDAEELIGMGIAVVLVSGLGVWFYVRRKHRAAIRSKSATA